MTVRAGTSNSAPRPPSIKDVAEVAGVTHQTVSRVLHGSPLVKDSTRERVLAAVEEVGYRPNLAARALVTRRSMAIGILAGELSSYGPATALSAMESAARQAGYRVAMTTVASSDPTAIGSALDVLLGQGVDGLAVISPRIPLLLVLESSSLTMPTVVLEPTRVRGRCSVSTDQGLGTRLLVRHLVDLGHRRIAYVAGPTHSVEAAVRRSAFLDELGALGLDPQECLTGDWTADAGYELGTTLLASTTATAVVAANDPMALGLLHSAREQGISVPERLSVVGFDDTPESAHFAPPLTTVRQDFREVGARAMAALLAAVGPSGAGCKRLLLEPQLVVRDSTAPPSETP